MDKFTFPSPPSTYSLASHPELFFLGHDSIPCMLYAIPEGAPLLLVHAHTNGCDVGSMRQPLQCLSESLRVHVLSFEYPGYGLAVGKANKRSIDHAADVVLRFILEDLKLNTAQIVWYGRSIGSGPVLRIADRISKERGPGHPAGVIVQCGFANFKDVAGHLFGRVAKRLVSPLWQNEKAIGKLHCPVLLIHGKNDTMIPIDHAERLWKAVALKEQSKFQTCDCGHNDFNFQRHTLRPIYDFLVSIISAATFPSVDFALTVPSSGRPLVRHLGPLRAKIPAYAFRSQTVIAWMRLILQRHDPEAAQNVASLEIARPGTPAIADDGRPARIGEQPNADTAATAATVPAVESSQVADTGVGEARDLPATGSESPAKATPRSQSCLAQPGPTSVRSEPHQVANQRMTADEVVDLSSLPPIEDVAEALGTLEGLMRTVSLRVNSFLERLQTRLDKAEDLESRSVEEVVALVEAEFWMCDPMLSLWEEVSIPSGDRTVLRLGSFWVDNRGQRGHDGCGEVVRDGGALRVPLWIYRPSPTQIRYFAEWTLLTLGRLRQSLSSHVPCSPSNCCAPGRLGGRGRQQRATVHDHPSRGVLATHVAAYFVNWLDKSKDAKAILQRFVSLHRQPLVGQTTDQTTPSSPSSPSSAPSQLEERGKLSSKVLSGIVGPVDGPIEKTNTEQAWSPREFSTAAREMLRREAGTPSADLADLYMRLWAPEQCNTDVVKLEDFGPQTWAAELLKNPATVVAAESRDLLSSSLLLHYELLLFGQRELDKTWNPWRQELQLAGLALCEAMRLQSHAGNRERCRVRPHARKPDEGAKCAVTGQSKPPEADPRCVTTVPAESGNVLP